MITKNATIARSQRFDAQYSTHVAVNFVNCSYLILLVFLSQCSCTHHFGVPTMTYTLSIEEAAAQLGDLVRRLRQDDSVVLLAQGVPVADILPRAQVPQYFVEIPTTTQRSKASEAFLRLAAEAASVQGAEEITDEVIRAEIDAYRRGE